LILLITPQINKLVSIMQNPRQYKIPDWFLNRQKDERDGKYVQLLSNALDTKLRDDLELLKKIRCHRGIRHYWGSVDACLCFISFSTACVCVDSTPRPLVATDALSVSPRRREVKPHACLMYASASSLYCSPEGPCIAFLKGQTNGVYVGSHMYEVITDFLCRENPPINKDHKPI
jgi:hypothetical protein